MGNKKSKRKNRGGALGCCNSDLTMANPNCTVANKDGSCPSGFMSTEKRNQLIEKMNTEKKEQLLKEQGVPAKVVQCADNKTNTAKYYLRENLTNNQCPEGTYYYNPELHRNQEKKNEYVAKGRDIFGLTNVASEKVNDDMLELLHEQKATENQQQNAGKRKRKTFKRRKQRKQRKTSKK
jgi:hypothetical protein